MIKIFIVEDQPKYKVEAALDYLKSKKLKFDFEIFSSIVEATRYLKSNLAEIDLAIVDLGVPLFNNEPIKSKIQGIEIVQDIESYIMMEEKEKLPTIINSSTKIEFSDSTTEEEYFSMLKDEFNSPVEHVDQLEGAYLYEFIQKNMPEKIEFQ